MLQEIGYGVIGVGSMGANHARSVEKLSGVKLLGVADTDPKNASAVAQRHACKPSVDYRDLLTDPNIKAVSVCVPTSSHEQVVTDALLAGKHVLVEKPIASTVDAALRMQSTARACNRLLMVGHIERFNPAVKQVKTLIDEGALGKVVSIIARRVGLFPPRIKDADISIDLAIHDVDIINYLLGTLPSKMMVDRRRHHIDSRDDAVQFMLHYPQATAYVQANWITPVKIRKLNITGTDGYLEMDYIAQSVKFYKSNYDKYLEVDEMTLVKDFVLKFKEPDFTEHVIAKREPLLDELEYFVDAIRFGGQIDSDHAVDALRVVLSKDSLNTMQ